MVIFLFLDAREHWSHTASLKNRVLLRFEPQPSTEGTWRWHALKVSLDKFAIYPTLVRPALFEILDLVLDDADGDFAHHGLLIFKLAVLVFLVIVSRLIKLAHIKVIN